MELVSLIQEYWVIALIVSLIILSIFTQLKSGSSQINLNIRASLDSNPNSGPPMRGPNDLIKTSNFEFTSSDPEFAPVMEALSNGDKINAIKILREARRLNLTEAKMFVDALDSVKGKI